MIAVRDGFYNITAYESGAVFVCTTGEAWGPSGHKARCGGRSVIAYSAAQFVRPVRHG